MKLTKKDINLIPSSYDIIGDILLFADFPNGLIKKERVVGDFLLSTHSNIKVICIKIRKYSGKFRLPKIKIIAGEKRKETLYKENKIRLKLDIEKVYFSSRLSTERQRINSLVKDGEEVLVMFSGCGVYPINISKNSHAKSIVGIEINPAAHKYAFENLRLNKVTNVELIKGDVRKVIPKIKKVFDRVLMPLPKGGEDYLDLALRSVKKKGVIHFYDFLNEKEFDLAKEKIAEACKKSKKKFKIERFGKCGQFAPGVFRVCVDFKIN